LPIQDNISVEKKCDDTNEYNWIYTDEGCAMHKINNEIHDCKIGAGLYEQLQCTVCKDVSDNIEIYHGKDNYYVFHKLCCDTLIKIFNSKIKDNYEYNDDFANKCEIPFNYGNVSNFIELHTSLNPLHELYDEFKKDNIYEKYQTIDMQDSLFAQFVYNKQTDKLVYLSDPRINEFSKKRFLKRFEKIFPNIKFN
jgi:hypothetical protein